MAIIEKLVIVIPKLAIKNKGLVLFWNLNHEHEGDSKVIPNLY